MTPVVRQLYVDELRRWGKKAVYLVCCGVGLIVFYLAIQSLIIAIDESSRPQPSDVGRGR